MHGNRYGRFIEEGRAFEISDPETPTPWTNVISNGRYGLVISQNGGGFSWVDHCQLNVLTRWDMDLIRDERGRFVYIADLDSDDVWSVTPSPCGAEFDRYRCVHRAGATTFETERAGIRSSWTLAATPSDTAEVWEVELTNTSDRPRRLRVAGYLEWCCGAAPDIKREFHRLFFTTTHDGPHRAIVATKNMWEAPFGDGDDHWNRPWPYAAAFGVGGLDVTTAVADKGEFLGRRGDQAKPFAMTGPAMRGRFGRFNDACAALGGDIELAPGESRTISYCLALGDNEEQALHLIERFGTPGAVRVAIDAATAAWDDLLSSSRVDTAATDFNLLNNTWLPYQAISARLMGRTGYYQQSGAYGYRDQLQDSQVWLPIEPERCASQILLHAAHQFADGSVYHWWNPLTETGHRTACSDDYLWLPFVVASYVRETGDLSLLERVVPFVDDEAGATVLEHCGRAIEHAFGRFSERGLPLIGDMDWNDGLSAVGTETEGESVWLALFLYGVLEEMGEIYERVGRHDTAQLCLARRESIGEAVNEHAWDGTWFRRATNRDGEWLGSAHNDAGKIFLNAQTWAILNDATTAERADSAWESVKELLLTDYGPLLLAPAYTEPDPKVGYITRYAPGARENGGVYMHAATWALAAAAKRHDVDAVDQIWRSVSPADTRCQDAEGVPRRAVRAAGQRRRATERPARARGVDVVHGFGRVAQPREHGVGAGHPPDVGGAGDRSVPAGGARTRRGRTDLARTYSEGAVRRVGLHARRRGAARDRRAGRRVAAERSRPERDRRHGNRRQLGDARRGGARGGGRKERSMNRQSAQRSVGGGTCWATRKGFTLIELLVVIAIIALLIGILLPALGQARIAARDVLDKINMKQVGLSQQMYLDDQGANPKMPNVSTPFIETPNPLTGSTGDIRSHRWYMMILLEDYLSGNSRGGIFICPRARGASSVLDPDTRRSMERGGKIQVGDPNPNVEGDEYVTEYWFNDSPPRVIEVNGINVNVGVSGQPISKIKHPNEVVWMADAVDWIPRHRDAAFEASIDGVPSESGASHLLFGDQRVELLTEAEYILGRDKYGSATEFYNWGHFYPDP
jgi:cellobiose phosphorylase